MNETQIMKIFEETAYVRMGGSPEELHCAEYLQAKCAELGLKAELEAFPVDMAEIKKAYAKNKELHGKEAAEIGRRVLAQVLEGAAGTLPEATANKPDVIALVGVNGAGKTTTAAKLAHRFSQNGKTVILGACDTFRAAANEQITAWAERLSIDLVPGRHGADSAAVAFDTVQAARARGRDIAVLDTAGRLHTKSNLLEELKKISRVVGKLDDE